MLAVKKEQDCKFYSVQEKTPTLADLNYTQNSDKDTTSSLHKLSSFRHEKKQTFEQEMETDDDHATMRENFSLVQNMFFIGYTEVLPAHFQEIMVENLCVGILAIWFVF